MKKVTMRQLHTVENWIYANARPLEVAKWNLTFGKGSVSDLVSEMVKYQNEDGGFGNGFEADILTPESAAIPSAEAIFMAQDYGLDLSDEWAKKLFRYFENTCQCSPSFWEPVPKSIENYPHPPWWNYSPDTQFSPNPSAVIASALILYGTDTQKRLGNEIAVKCLAFLNSDAVCGDHDIYCLQRLYTALHDIGSSLIDEQTAESMKRRIGSNVCYDEGKWLEYVAQPLDFAKSPASLWYPILEKGIESNIDYWVDHLTDEGYWPINFSWGVNTDSSNRAAKSWKGYMAVVRVRILRAFDAIEI